jgi:hypothetical protein
VKPRNHGLGLGGQILDRGSAHTNLLPEAVIEYMSLCNVSLKIEVVDVMEEISVVCFLCQPCDNLWKEIRWDSVKI